MAITWRKCESYEEAQDYSGVIYLFEWGGKPHYWGIANGSFFGGNPRWCGCVDRKLNPRYNPGYRHLIDGSLQHGACLYIGKLDDEDRENIKDIENYLIYTYPSEMNIMNAEVQPEELDIEHIGDIPYTINPVINRHGAE